MIDCTMYTPIMTEDSTEDGGVVYAQSSRQALNMFKECMDTVIDVEILGTAEIEKWEYDSQF